MVMDIMVGWEESVTLLWCCADLENVTVGVDRVLLNRIKKSSRRERYLRFDMHLALIFIQHGLTRQAKILPPVSLRLVDPTCFTNSKTQGPTCAQVEPDSYSGFNLPEPLHTSEPS